MLTLNEDPIGEIKKQSRGFIEEAVTDADTFTVSFPMDLSVEVKATLLGLTFLIVSDCFEARATFFVHLFGPLLWAIPYQAHDRQ